MDDHVHPSLLGQAEVARAVLGCMSALPEPLTVPESAIVSLPDDATYASRLGTNAWDDFRVRHNMRTLLGVTFMKRNNAERCAAVEAACRSFEESQSAAMRAAMDEWKTARPHAGGLRPLTGMVARVHLREKRVADALPLYDIARTQVPQYTSWYLEYLYFSLVCREVLNGTLQEREREQAAEGIAQAKFPYLLAARPRMNAEDLVACDQALFMSYVRTGNVAAARMLADDGARNAGRFAPMYQQMASQLPPR
jgi:hypothetical protein